MSWPGVISKMRRMRRESPCLTGVTPDMKNETGYHSVLERLYFAAGMPEKSEEEGKPGYQSIRREEPSLSEEEKLRVPERIAAAYYIMGRAWMQTGQQDEHALKLLETSIAFYDQNAVPTCRKHFF